MVARSLELIYTVANWPPGARALSQSLKDLGKSRADLWQFAGNFGLERAIHDTNANGQNSTLEMNSEAILCAIEGPDKCQMRLNRPIPFRTGRIDCVNDDPTLKMTQFGFEATKKERHSNSHGTGKKVIQDLKNDFNLTARESIALFAVHGLSSMGRNHEEGLKYKWIGGMSDSQRKGSTTFSNMYHKILNGKTYDRGNAELYTQMGGYLVGDKQGNPVGKSGFNIRCGKFWTTEGRRCGGPCHFKPTNTGCNPIDDNPDHVMRQRCFEQTSDGLSFTKKTMAGCEDAEMTERPGGFRVQTGGPPIPESRRCTTGWQFLLPFEFGLVVDFEVDPETNMPFGCGAINGSWIERRYLQPFQLNQYSKSYMFE